MSFNLDHALKLLGWRLQPVGEAEGGAWDLHKGSKRVRYDTHDEAEQAVIVVFAMRYVLDGVCARFVEILDDPNDPAHEAAVRWLRERKPLSDKEAWQLAWPDFGADPPFPTPIDWSRVRLDLLRVDIEGCDFFRPGIAQVQTRLSAAALQLAMPEQAPTAPLRRRL